jgi:hypothetical protein
MLSDRLGKKDSIAVLRGGSKGLYMRSGTLVKPGSKSGDLATDSIFERETLIIIVTGSQ